MIKYLKRLFSNNYLEWEQYKSRIDFIDEYTWQQKVRKHNLKTK